VQNREHHSNSKASPFWKVQIRKYQEKFDNRRVAKQLNEQINKRWQQ
jgi:hypothetical protein